MWVFCTDVKCTHSMDGFESILLPWLGRSKDCMSREDFCIAIGISGMLPVLASCCVSLVPYQHFWAVSKPHKAFQSSTTMVRSVLAAFCEPPAETCSGFHFSTYQRQKVQLYFPAVRMWALICEDLPLHLTPGKWEVVSAEALSNLTWILVQAREKLRGEGLVWSNKLYHMDLIWVKLC